MSKSTLTPDRLFDRSWRPGQPFRPRISRARRWAMIVALFFLCIIIGGYWYITDSNRVKQMAEAYLSALLGGPVKVDRVPLYVDASHSEESLLFSADSFLVQYDPRALLAGKIEATRIVAVDPRVHVTEDTDTGRRNYTRLLESRPSTSMPSASIGNPIILPEIVLR